MKIAVLAITNGGCELGKKVASGLAGADFYPCRGKLRETLLKSWREYDGLICIMATGIVVRTLARELVDKRVDPAVLVCDERGQFVISLLSGHLGGGNELACRVADLCGGQAVITTSSDVQGKTALDIWVRDCGLWVADKNCFTTVMGRLVNEGQVAIYSDYRLQSLPPDLYLVQGKDEADLLISCRIEGGNFCYLHPPTLVAGIGCNRNTRASEIEDALQEACRVNKLAFGSVAALASIDIKNDEVGLLEVAAAHGWEISFYSKDELNSVAGVSESALVKRVTGAKGVSEPASILASGGGNLVVGKMKLGNVTVAISEKTDFVVKARGIDE